MGSSKNKLLSFLAIIFTILFWGFSYISTKTLLQTLSPFQVAAGRFLLAAGILLVISLATGKLQSIQKRDLPRMLFSAFSGIFVYFIFENSGLRLTTAGMGSLIIATIPVLNVIVSSVLLRKKAALQTWIGVLLSAGGVYLVIRGGANFSGASFLGNLLVIGAAISWVVYTLLNQPLTQKYDTFSLNLYQTLFGAALLFILALCEGRPIPVLKTGIFLNLGFLALCCSALGYLFYNYALRRLGSTVVTTFINFIPVCGVLGGIFILKEPFGFEQIIGGLVILGGVMLVSFNQERNSVEQTNIAS
ncbi:MAG TPA: DMT family transporter [Bacillota bacterium]|nr:DMT family transporter [Bacillota bacterium]